MDLIFEHWWIIILPLIPIGIYVHYQYEHDRTRHMGLAAARLGLAFEIEDRDLPFRAISLLTNGYVRNVAKGEVGDCEVVLLDHTHSQGFGDDTGRFTQSVGAVRVAGLKLPAFLLEAKRARHNSIRFDSHPQFSKNYRLSGADETAIRQLFVGHILDYFQHAGGKSVECDGEWMVIWHDEHQVDGDKLNETKRDITRRGDGTIDARGSLHETLMRNTLGETIRILDVFRHNP